MKYRKKTVIIEANQFLLGEPIPKGVCFGWTCGISDQAHVHTIHDGQHVMIEFGDWIIPEPDGEHFYPCRDDIFKRTYEPLPTSAQPETSP